MDDLVEASRVYGLITRSVAAAQPGADLDEHLREFAAECAQVLGKPGVGVLLSADGPRARLGAAWGESVDRLLDWELTMRRGPGTLCISTGQTAVYREFALCEEEWREWSALAFRAGFGSLLCVPVAQAAETMGALLVFAAESEFDDESAVRVAAHLGAAVAVGLRWQRIREGDAQRIGQLERALESRVLIEQAKGMLSERWRCSTDAAFERMRAVARRNGLRLHDVARGVVDGAGEPALARAEWSG